MADFVVNSGKGTIGAIIASIKLVAIFAYMWARKSLIDEQMIIEKQEYEQKRIKSARDEIDSEDLDGK